MAGTATVTCKCTPSSDGGGTISEMTAAAIERGYKFIAITDHTKGLKIAGGLEI
jgi:histidinol phosphatase-like PHP family hydrolase